jgi:hypothetical protein
VMPPEPFSKYSLYISCIYYDNTAATEKHL